MSTTETRRKALGGRCPGCGAQTIRGTDQDGNRVAVGLGDHTASDELRAWVAGTATFRATWVGHIQLDRRTADDLRDDPAGFREGRIYAEHRCTTKETP